MSYLKLLLWCVVITTIYGVTYAVGDIEKNTNEKEEILKQINSSSEEVKENLLNTRTGRILVHSRTPSFTLRRRQPVNIRSRSDHFPLRPQIRRIHNGLPSGQKPQSIRYGYESLKSSKYIPSSKGGSAQFFNNGKGGFSAYRQQMQAHANSVHVPALSQQFIHNFKASPAFNGQVVVHPVNQPPQQQQQQQSSQQDNTYPKYIKPPQQQQPVAAAVIPQQSPQQHQPQQPPLLQYPELKQFPIPDQEQMQKYNEQHEKYLQQQKYLTPRDPYYQQQQQQLPLQQQFNYGVQQPQYMPQKPILQQQLQQQQPQPSIPIHEVANIVANNIQLPPTAEPQKMYSVYEENDMTELQDNNYQTAVYQGLDKEAQEYLKFMNTNEYFLPKRDPNYKLIDEENDRRQYAQLKTQQQQQQQQQQLQSKLQQSPLQQYAQSFYQQQQQQQPQTTYQQPQQSYEQPDQQLQQYLNTQYTDSSGATSYNQPIQVPKVFYNYNEEEEEEPNSSERSAASSTVVKTSYQTGYNQNQFIVNSQNNKVSKYKNHKPTQSTTLVSTQAPVQTNNVYSQVRQNSQNNRTPEPLRFEFTERDAMVGGVSYTHAPQAQLRYKAVENTATTSKLPLVESSTPSSTGATVSATLRAKTYHHHNHVVRPLAEENDDDPEDGDDMQEAGTNLYGRQPVANNNNNLNNNQQQSSTTEKPPSEQNDTEEYCERICAIVEDENEEIVCGSDGYMYTSEAQMECYASCLHIDVTIQGKGSCSAR